MNTETTNKEPKYWPAEGKLLARISQDGKMVCIFKSPPTAEQGHAMAAALATPVGEGQEPYGFASVLIDTFQYAVDNGKQPTFSKGDLLYFIEQLGKCQYVSPPAPVAVAPKGWKLVPEVATLEMKNSGWQECERQGIDPEEIEMQTVWTAMHLKAPACIDKVKELNQ